MNNQQSTGWVFLRTFLLVSYAQASKGLDFHLATLPTVC
jgi:hypothetical protein